MDGGSHFVGVGYTAGAGSDDSRGLQEGDDVGAAGRVSKADQRKGGISSHHRGLILEHFEERLVKTGTGSVLAHDPGIGVTHFLDRMQGQTNHFRIPMRCARVVACHALTELDERMLDVARVLFVLQVFADLLVGELASKPGVPPKEERQEDDQPGGDEKERAIPRGHFVMRGRGGLPRRIFRSKFRLITSFRRGWRTGHVFSWFLTFFGRGWLLGGCCLALPQESAVAKLPENIQEEDAGDAQHDEALEKTIDGGDGATHDDPADPRERDEAEQDGNQEHHGKQWTSSISFIRTIPVVTPQSEQCDFAIVTVEILRAPIGIGTLRMTLAATSDLKA